MNLIFFVSNCLIDMYGKCGCANISRRVFDRMLGRDVVSWSPMLNGYTRKKDFDGFLRLVVGIEVGGMVPNLVTWSTMISCYVFYDRAEEALNCFGKMQLMDVKPDVVSCNVLFSALSQSSLISRYMQKGNIVQVKGLFQKLQSRFLKADLVSWNIIINCDAEEGNTDGGLGVLAHMQATGISPDSVSWNTLIKGYVRSKQIGDAMQLLSRIDSPSSKQNPGSWNTLMTNHINHGDGEEALCLFHLMRNHGIQPNAITFTCILHACALLGALANWKINSWMCDTEQHHRQIHKERTP
ncbi:hypothetical protein AAC387_Pa10g0213 [Persea americana]